MTSLPTKFTVFILRNRWPVILTCLVLAGGAGLGLRQLSFTTDYTYFFSRDNPDLAAFTQLERTYASQDRLVWVVRHETALATNPSMLALIHEFTDDAWRVPYTTRVDSLTNHQFISADGDTLIVRDLVPSVLDLTEVDGETIRLLAQNEPLVRNRLLSVDATTTAIIATLKVDRTKPEAMLEAMNHARQLAARYESTHPDLEIAITGTAALANAFFESTQSDAFTLFPVTFIVILLIFLVVTRSLPGTLCAASVVLLAPVMAMGIAGWLKIAISPPSGAIPTVVLTIAVADAIHILLSILRERAKGVDRYRAIVSGVTKCWNAVFLTSATTAIGLISLNSADAPPFHDLGSLAAIGAISAWFLSITLLPALLSTMSFEANHAIETQNRVMGWIADIVVAKQQIIVICAIVATVVATLLLPRLVFNDQLTEYFDDRVEFRRDTDWAEEHLTGIYQLNYSLPAKESQGITDPQYLTHLDNFASWLARQSHVVHVASFSDIMKRLNKSTHGDNALFDRLPENHEEAAQYLLLYEMSLPYGLDLNDQINIDKSATRLVATLKNTSTAHLNALRNDARTWLETNTPQYMWAEPTGITMMFFHIGRTNMNSVSVGTIIALVLVSLCLFLALRDLKLGAVSFIPNFTPPLLAFGIYAAVNSEIGLWASTIVVIALGLIVDGTVHILSKFKRARAQGIGTADAIREALEAVGIPLWISSLSLAVGFGLLALSTFRITEMMGIMVSLTVIVALITDLLLLPAVLLNLARPSLFNRHLKQEQGRL